MRSRADARQGISETFQYDGLNRVTSSTLTAGATQTSIAVAYNALGNITSKSDIGAYSYGPNASACGASPFAGPHAVSAVSGAKTAAYCYDANGNLTGGDGRVVAWSAFNMPITLQQNLRRIDIAYGPSRARFKRVDQNETGSTTTHYIAGGAHEVIQSGTTLKHRTTIAGIAVVTETVTAPAATETIYLLRDHLGSADVITDAMGQVLTRYSFDAWGRRRDVAWAAFTTVPAAIWQNGKISRGFTAHEQLDQVGLVHMNGRVYDPELGRFLSADPFVADVSNLQALNRYSYVENNPLSFTDPSGYFLSGLFKAIGKAFGAIFRAVAHAVKAVLNSSIIRSLIQIAICISTAAPTGGLGCAAASAGLTLASGGTPLQALKAFAFSFAQAEIFTAVGLAFGGADAITQTLVHGTVSGALSVAQGGNFVQGFVTGALGKVGGLIAGNALGHIRGQEGIFLRTAVSATFGGLGAELTGGKFANGALTAGFAHLFNAEGLKHEETPETTTAREAHKQCAYDCTFSWYGVDLAATGGTIAAGEPLRSYPRVGVGGPTPSGGTSYASEFFRDLFRGVETPNWLRDRLPQGTTASSGARTTNFGAQVGRTVPYLGWGALAVEGYSISRCVSACMRPYQNHSWRNYSPSVENVP